MKKIFLKGMIAVVFLFVPSFVLAETSPMADWYHGNSIKLNNGQYSSKFSVSYREQDGYAIVLGQKLHYWLYDTYTNNNGKGGAIINQVVPKWVENMGYVIDFDNIETYNPNDGLANSVKALMRQRGCDVSVTLITRESGYPTKMDYVVINNYDKSQDKYWTIIYNLYK